MTVTKRRSAVMLAVATVLLLARVVWELSSPLGFEQTKIWIYVRDALTVGPASILMLLALRPWAASVTVRPRVWVAVWVGFVVVCSALIAQLVLLAIPAIVDESAYLWTAQLLADGRVVGNAGSGATLVQYVGDVGNNRITAFFPGSSVPLAVGVAAGVEHLVNPVLAGVLVAVSYWSARRLFDGPVAATAAVLLATSPFLMWQAASYFSQVWTAIFTVAAFTFVVTARSRLEVFLGAFLAASVLLSRPASAAALMAVLLAWQFAVHRSWRGRLHGWAVMACGAVVPVTMFAVLNWQTTGNWLVTGHRALLPGETAVVGLNTIRNIVLNLAGLSIEMTALSFAGAGVLILGFWRARRQPVVLAIAGYAIVQLLGYSLYYNHGISYGPRYMLEVTPLLVAVLASGIVGVLGGGRLDGAKSRVGIALAMVLVVLAGVMGVGRASVYNDRARFLDLDPVLAQLPPEATVVVGSGPFDYPDPFYPAFVANGTDPFQPPVLFLRGDNPETCRLVDQRSHLPVYFLNPVERFRAPDYRVHMKTISPGSCGNYVNSD